MTWFSHVFNAMYFLNKGSVFKERGYMLKEAFAMKSLEWDGQQMMNCMEYSTWTIL